MLGTIINNIARKLTPKEYKPLSIEDVYPCLKGQAERNTERMNRIKEEMGERYILHPKHKAKRLKNKRPV